jgi:CBS domain-containing protein
MTADVVTVSPRTPFKDIATLLSTHHISSVPVVDAGHRVLGVVSEADLVAKYGRRSSGQPKLWTIGRRQRSKAAATTAEGLMTSPAITITTDAHIVTAARRMSDHKVKRLPVVDTDGRLVGIISRHDLVGVFVRRDDDIAAEIRTDVLLRALCMAPPDMEVTVHDGLVTLRGQTERRSMVAVAVALCQRIDGVVDVNAELTFALDDTKVDDATAPQNVGILHGMWGQH